MAPLPTTRAELTCIHLHKTWQINQLWQIHPQYQSRDDLHTIAQNLADEPSSANVPAGTRAEITCIPLHKPWQINLLWPMELPRYQKRYAFNTTTQNLADDPTLPMVSPPQYQSRDALNISTPNKADKPILATGPPTGTRAEMNCLPLHKKHG